MSYSKLDVENALREIRNDGASVRGVARKYGIPHTTLADKLKCRSSVDARKGPATVLSKREEELLVQWSKAMCRKGMPVTQRQIAEAVGKVVKFDGRSNPFTNDVPGRKWMQLFMKRHPDISLRQPETVGVARALVTERAIREWHNSLGQYVLEKTGSQDLLQDPRRIINADESGFYTNPSSSLVLAPKGCKDVYEIKGNEKEMITVLATFTAEGVMVPPCIVYPYERIPQEIVRQVNPEWSVGKSKSGWMTAEVFFCYVANTLLPFLKSANTPFPVLFLIDGHKSHISYELAQFCEENDIILYALLPNSTHILQPADVGLFGPLKKTWRKVVEDFKLQSNVRTITRANFAPLLEKTIKSVTNETMKKAFRKCGLFPFDVNNVDFTKCMTHESRVELPFQKLDASQQLFIESLFPSGRVAQFRQCEGDWEADETAKELFYFWKKLKEHVAASTSVPQSASTSVLTVHTEAASSSPLAVVLPSPTVVAGTSSDSSLATPSSSSIGKKVAGSSISPAFADSILWPGASPVKKTGARKKIKFPSAIGAGKWKDYWKEKAEEKQKQEDRKREREMKKQKKFENLMSAKRKLVESSSSEEEEEEFEASGYSSDDVDWTGAPSPTLESDEEEIDVDSFVIVKFQLPKISRLFIGRVREKKNDSLLVKFLRRERKTRNFVYPLVDDVQSINVSQILRCVNLVEAGSTTRCANKFVAPSKILEIYPSLE